MAESCRLSVRPSARLGALKMLDVKMTDQFAQHEIAGHEGHENDGQK